MRLYATWTSIPEVAALPEELRRSAVRDARRKALLQPLSLAVLGCGGLAIAVIHPYLSSVLGHWSMAATGILAAALGFGMDQLLYHRARPYLRAVAERASG